jgi:hypothetical protein
MFHKLVVSGVYRVFLAEFLVISKQMMDDDRG